MIYQDLVNIIGTLPEGYEWIYGMVSAFVVCLYAYSFVKIFFALFEHSSRGRY